MRLAIDTATTATSVALLDGEVCVASATVEERNPGDVLASLIDELLSSSGTRRGDLMSVAVGVGPGPFTSTRVGIAVARAIGLALGIPVNGICTHDAIAAARQSVAPAPGDLVVATDARRKEIYWALYREGLRINGPTVGKPQGVVAEYRAATWVGNGLNRYPDLMLEVSHWSAAVPSAEWIGRLANAALESGTSPSAADALTDHDAQVRTDQYVGNLMFAPRPLYLRRPDAKPTPTKQ